MEKIYVVTVLNSGEAVLDSDCIVRVFKNKEDALRAFKSEKDSAVEYIKEGARYAAEDEFESIDEAYKHMVREETETSYVAYDDYRIYAVSVQFKEIDLDGNCLIVTTF